MFSNPTPHPGFTFNASLINQTVAIPTAIAFTVTPTSADAAATLRIRGCNSANTKFSSIISGDSATFDIVSQGSVRATGVSDGNVIEIEVTAAAGNKQVYTYFIAVQ